MEFTEQFWLMNVLLFFSCQILRNSSKGKECYSSHYYLCLRVQLKNLLGKEEILDRGRREELNDNILLNGIIIIWCLSCLATKLSHFGDSVTHFIPCSSYQLASTATALEVTSLTKLKTSLLPSSSDGEEMEAQEKERLLIITKKLGGHCRGK